jgi:RNA polymerase primary sigma factor
VTVSGDPVTAGPVGYALTDEECQALARRSLDRYRYKMVHHGRAELTQLAMVIIWRASLRYDPTRGASFDTFALEAVRFGFGDERRASRRVMQLGMHGPSTVEAFVARQSGDGPVTVEMMRQRFQVLRKADDAEVGRVIQWCAGSELSLDATADDDRSLWDMLAAEPEEAPWEVQHEDAFAQVEAMVGTLKPLERSILARRILAADPETLGDVGTDYAITGERVRQVQAKLARKIRAALKEAGHPWLELMRPSMRRAAGAVKRRRR